MGFFSFLKRDTAPDLPPLRLHNTLSGALEEFSPLSPREVKMYNCGPTPYDQMHIGNLVPAILADTLRHTLNLWGYQVKQVMNITDFGHLTGDNENDPNNGDDKMVRGLKRDGLPFTMKGMRALAEKYAAIFFDDISQLGVNTSLVTYPRASDYIPEQIALIKTLEQKGYAYRISDGIYYDTAKFAGYGKLGHINLEGQKEGARVEEKEEKKHPQDFVLWKSSTTFGWPSPWGKGFPGWHIECTAMIFKLLGRQIDIHTGGIEHIPIHHNNEIAQAEAATGKQYVKYWLHNAHITIENKKISKSLGNTVYLHSITDRGISARAFRYWYLTGHYRTQMNFTWEAIEGASQALTRLTRAFLEAGTSTAAQDPAVALFKRDVCAALANDLDTPRVIARTWELVKDQSISPAAKRSALLFVDKVLGLGLSDTRPSASLTVVEETDLPEEVQSLTREREDARKEKDFKKADELRGKIEAAGYDIKDTPEGARLTKK
ncbi:MAG TPA: cysteine--tRNA ligase [Candidatus Paceibacterota bacterium]|nr:cysteine--tRNA ligase [Candidatus Paceibacterota bacterium]